MNPMLLLFVCVSCLSVLGIFVMCSLTVCFGGAKVRMPSQVIYEVPDMEDLGLVSLRSIVRGAVRIEKNPQLCYVDTIDWTSLTSVDHEDDFVLQNKASSSVVSPLLCAVCCLK